MPALQLHVPRQTQDQGVFIDLRPRQVQHWVAQLPTADIVNAAQQVLRALVEANRVKMPEDQRRQVLELLRGPTDEIIASLKRRYAGAPPLTNKRHLPTIRLVTGLLDQFANGYKVVVSDLVRGAKKGLAQDPRFCAALSSAMGCLSRRLVESYHLYIPEPPGLWGELHLLFLLAERQGVARTCAEPADRRKLGLPSIEHQYKQLLLLALAGPFHLMRGEAERIYRDHSATWARHVELLPLPPGQIPVHRFFIDFAADAPPRYAPSDTRTAPSHGRIVDTVALVPILERSRHDRATFPFDPSLRDRSTLTDRLQRQMYDRLYQAWKLPRPERTEQRLARRTELYLVAGLSTCHHLFGGNLRVVANGSPSSDEATVIVEAVAGNQPTSDEPDTVSAIPPVRVHRATASVLEIEADTEDDGEPALIEVREQQYIACAWQQRNESRDGLGLFLFGTCPPQVQVGEMVAFGTGQPRGDAPWGLGIIRWARVHPEKSLELGIQTCKARPLAVLTRAIEGTGKGGDFNQGLLLRPIGDADEMVLMTPPAIYDEGTVLSLQTREKTTKNVRLTGLVESTSRFTEFKFTDLR